MFGNQINLSMLNYLDKIELACYIKFFLINILTKMKELLSFEDIVIKTASFLSPK